MLTVTTTACTRLTQILDGRPDHVAARIVRRKGRLKLKSSKKRPGDEVFEHEGRTVLLLDESIAAHLKNRTLDTRNTKDGAKLRFRRTRNQGQA